MANSSERRALILLTVLICLGAAARVSRATRNRPVPTAADRTALDRQIARVESVRAAGRVPRATRVPRARVIGAEPPALREPPLTTRHDIRRGPTDLDLASASEIERLPYVGRVLAARIVAERDTCGMFGSLEELKRVRGVGDGLAKRLAPLVTFSGASRPMSASRPPGCDRADKGAALRRRGR